MSLKTLSRGTLAALAAMLVLGAGAQADPVTKLRIDFATYDFGSTAPASSSSAVSGRSSSWPGSAWFSPSPSAGSMSAGA
jgi:hypothetical protein